MSDEQHIIAESWSDSMIELLTDQHRVVSKLLDLARYQGKLIETGRTEPLLGLLAQRQKLIDEFTSMQERLGRLTDDRERQLQQLHQTQRTMIQDLMDQISEKLNLVMAQDEIDQKTLAAARDKVKQELRATGNMQQARNAYHHVGAPSSRFADQRG